MKFPKVPPKNKITFIMQVGDDLVACVVKKEVVKYYYWDQIAKSYNRCSVYMRVK